MKKLLLGVLCLSMMTILAGCLHTNETAKTAPTNTVNDDKGDFIPLPQVKPAADVGANTNTAKLAACLTEKGVTMYGTEWCGHCKDQKALFGDDFADVNYVDCDAQKPACVAAGVRGFPTWKDSAGNAYPGTQSLARLAEVSGCEL